MTVPWYILGKRVDSGTEVGGSSRQWDSIGTAGTDKEGREVKGKTKKRD